MMAAGYFCMVGVIFPMANPQMSPRFVSEKIASMCFNFQSASCHSSGMSEIIAKTGYILTSTITVLKYE